MRTVVFGANGKVAAEVDDRPGKRTSAGTALGAARRSIARAATATCRRRALW